MCVSIGEHVRLGTQRSLRVGMQVCADTGMSCGSVVRLHASINSVWTLTEGLLCVTGAPGAVWTEPSAPWGWTAVGKTDQNRS